MLINVLDVSETTTEAPLYESRTKQTFFSTRFDYSLFRSSSMREKEKVTARISAEDTMSSFPNRYFAAFARKPGGLCSAVEHLAYVLAHRTRCVFPKGIATTVLGYISSLSPAVLRVFFGMLHTAYTLILSNEVSCSMPCSPSVTPPPHAFNSIRCEGETKRQERQRRKDEARGTPTTTGKVARRAPATESRDRQGAIDRQKNSEGGGTRASKIWREMRDASAKS